MLKTTIEIYDNILKLSPDDYQRVQRLTAERGSVMHEHIVDCRNFERRFKSKRDSEEYKSERQPHYCVIMRVYNEATGTNTIACSGFIQRESEIDYTCTLKKHFDIEANIWTSKRFRGKGYGKLIAKQLILNSFNLECKVKRVDVFGTELGKGFWKSVKSEFKQCGNSYIANKINIL